MHFGVDTGSCKVGARDARIRRTDTVQVNSGIYRGQHNLYWHTGTGKDEGAAHDFRVGRNDLPFHPFTFDQPGSDSSQQKEMP